MYDAILITRACIYIVYNACTVLFFTLVAKLDGTQSFTAYTSASSMSAPSCIESLSRGVRLLASPEGY